jgi:transcriptional regulator with XRE-family HTH domain
MYTRNVVDIEFGQQVKALRLALDITLSELAKKLGIKWLSMSNIELGLVPCTKVQESKLRKILGM